MDTDKKNQIHFQGTKNLCVLSFSKIFITGEFVVKNFIMRGEPTEKTKIKLAQNYHLRFCSP